MATRDNSIRKLADSMQVLADTVNSANPHLKVSDVAQCCRLHYSFLFYFGAAIGFTDLELLMKVDNFVEASKNYDTVQAISIFTLFLHTLVVLFIRKLADSSSLAMATRVNFIRKLADSTQVLADTVNSANPHLKASDVAQCCRLHYSFLFYFGASIGFTDLELQMKVDNFVEASKKYDTIQAIVETEIINGFAMNNNSNCRNLVRSKRVLNLVREVMEQILARRGKSLAETFAIAYDQVFASYHGWTSSDGFILSIGLSKDAMIAALEELPSRDLLLRLLNEDEESVKDPIQKYVTAAKATVQYFDNLFLSTETGAELLRLI